MKFKRFMALALAGVMTLGMTVTSFAETITEPTNSATIKKTVASNEGVDDSGLPQEFEFTFTAKNQEPALDAVTITFESTASFTEGLSEAIDATAITTPGVYEYTIAETKVGNGDPAELWSSDAKTYDLKVYVKNGANGLEYSYAIFDGDTKQDEAAFENIYRPISGENDSASLTVTKNVTKGEWSAVTSYDFSVTFGKTDYTDPGDFTITGGIGDEKNAIAITADTPYTFSLKDGETFSIYGLPQGITYEISETNKDSFGSYYQNTTISGADEKDEDALTASGTLDPATTAVEYQNIFEDVPVTGLAISVAPFVAMFAAVGAAIALYVAAKRRVR